jgi:cell filamentation protein
VTFDPFGDFETRGYLRNLEKEKDPAIVKRLEHASFTTGIDEAFAALEKKNPLTYADVLGTHKILFEAFYPWAGQDRSTTSPDIAVGRGDVLFANPKYIQKAVEYALKVGNDPAQMKAKPGAVMGYLAHGHPFLDGNGRTIMVVHCVLAQRAGFSIDWAKIDKAAYLAALTQELDDPRKGTLDTFLKPFVRSAVTNLSEHIAEAKGLDGSAGAAGDAVYGKNDDPVVQAQYKQQQLRREELQSSVQKGGD